MDLPSQSNLLHRAAVGIKQEKEFPRVPVLGFLEQWDKNQKVNTQDAVRRSINMYNLRIGCTDSDSKNINNEYKTVGMKSMETDRMVSPGFCACED